MLVAVGHHAMWLWKPIDQGHLEVPSRQCILEVGMAVREQQAQDLVTVSAMRSIANLRGITQTWSDRAWTSTNGMSPTSQQHYDCVLHHKQLPLS